MAQATTFRAPPHSSSNLGVSAESERLIPAVPERRFAFWAAVATSVTYSIFLVGFGIGSFLSKPWDIALPVGASILIAPSFVLLMVGIHNSARASKRVWTQSALAFALLYAAFVSIVYVTWLFVVEPHVVSGTQSSVGLLTFEKGSFIQMVDGLGYTYMSLAVFMSAPAFGGSDLPRWIHGVAIASGPAAIGVFLSYVLFTFPWSLLGLPGTLLTLAYAVLLAVHYHGRDK